MRDIKFRGKNENGWHYGLLTFMFNSYAISHVEDENTVDLVDEETIGQYTGLKDKNGVEIYEGDILCGWIGSHWHSGEDKFEEVVKYDEKTASYNFPAIEVRHGDLRVIGNIFESGEILNDSKNPE